MKIGPFFFIEETLLYNICVLEHGRNQAGKTDNSYSHEQLYDDYYTEGEYIDYPRGRVVWDKELNQSIIYIDSCINCDNIIEQIVEIFELDNYIIEGDEHYRCKKCVGDLFD